MESEPLRDALRGKPHYLAEARSRLAPRSPTGLLFEEYSARWQASFSGDPRFVREWTLVPKGEGAYDLRCTSLVPEGCEPVTASGAKVEPSE